MTVLAESRTPRLVEMAEKERDSRTRTTLCDALLPKLSSGAVRVKDAEQSIQEATA